MTPFMNDSSSISNLGHYVKKCTGGVKLHEILSANRTFDFYLESYFLDG